MFESTYTLPLILLVLVPILLMISMPILKRIRRSKEIASIKHLDFSNYKDREEMFKLGGIIAYEQEKLKSKIIFKKGEYVLFESYGIQIGMDIVNKSYAGTTFKVAKGVCIMGGLDISVPRLETLADLGDLILTTHRIFFFSKTQQIEINLKDLSALQYNHEEIAVYRTGKSKVVYFKGGNIYPVAQTIEWLISSDWYIEENYFYETESKMQHMVIIQGGSLDKRAKEVRLDLTDTTYGRVLPDIATAYILAKIIMADGRVEDIEKKKVEEVLGKARAISEDQRNQIIKFCEKFMTEIAEGTETYYLKEMIDLIKKMDLHVRKSLIDVCEIVSQADGMVSEEEKHFITYLKEEVLG